MKKNRIILFIIIVMLAACVSACSLALSSELSNVENEGDNIMNEFKITDTVKSISNTIFNDGCVRNEKDAAEIARVMFKSVYGENFDCGLPLIVNFDDAEQVWLVKTQLPDDMEGGSKYLIIRKANAEVVAIWAIK